jgi:uncharacterized membrane protein YbhN (UPF0104 family)
MLQDMKRRFRGFLALLLIILTLGLFGYYIDHHSYLLTQLSHIQAPTIIWLLLLYSGWFLALIMIIGACLRICRVNLGLKESFLLNAYSTLINFFIPGQGGTVARGAYLNKVKGLNVKSYIFVTLLYYMCYAIISGLILLIPSRPIWQSLLGIALVVLVSGLSIYLFRKKSSTKLSDFDISLESVLLLSGATLFQAMIQVAIYAVELHSINPHITLTQVITYTGAANFALFVALTPGAIGIREAFLLFTQHLHHISGANIIAANVIDRAIFLIVLGALFIFTLSFHSKGITLWRKHDLAESTPADTLPTNK